VVVCDIRSALGNQLPAQTAPGAPIDKADVIVSSLFRDSGGAAIVSSVPPAPKIVQDGKSDFGGLEIVSKMSAILPDSFDLVKYREMDEAVISLKIDKTLPATVGAHLRPLVDTLLAPFQYETIFHLLVSLFSCYI
jgi:predicted naringenin-chalcone synthase